MALERMGEVQKELEERLINNEAETSALPSKQVTTKEATVQREKVPEQLAEVEEGRFTSPEMRSMMGLSLEERCNEQAGEWRKKITEIEVEITNKGIDLEEFKRKAVEKAQEDRKREVTENKKWDDK